ncbi:LytTR family DNA-binding domain-containing protein [Pedobacter sp. ASV28]|uniref:LytTR family DNA-binding domain-containing protein n=1 Tax=Pedobacter sp. ASV28 TaxID=2795123 RepID=UPI0018EB7815|nr:LytTR family DNA-binding domain-containing protein [Pedobacter sp. ASV28]
MTVQYRNKKLRLAAALVASVYILFHGKPFALHKALHSPAFYTALAVSFCVALLLLNIIHHVTLWLDRELDWRERPFVRSAVQSVLGILLPAFTDLILIYLYFETLGQNIIDNGFLLIDFPVIVMFIVLFNAYYLIHYLLLSERKIVAEIRKEKPDRNDVAYLTGDMDLVIDQKGTHIRFSLEDVLYFYRYGKKVNLFMINGVEHIVPLTIATLAERYVPFGFSQINRGVIINNKIVKGYYAGYRKNTLQIIVRHKYANLLPDHSQTYFQVTKDYISGFKNSFEQLSGKL